MSEIIVIKSINYDGELANVLFKPSGSNKVINLGNITLPFEFDPSLLVPPLKPYGDYTIFLVEESCTYYLNVPAPTPTPTPSNTTTKTPTPTPTPTQTPTQTIDPCKFITPTPTKSVTPTKTPKSSPTPTPSWDPCITPFPTKTPTPTNTQTPTLTPTPTLITYYITSESGNPIISEDNNYIIPEDCE